MPQTTSIIDVRTNYGKRPNPGGVNGESSGNCAIVNPGASGTHPGHAAIHPDASVQTPQSQRHPGDLRHDEIGLVRAQFTPIACLFKKAYTQGKGPVQTKQRATRTLVEMVLRGK